VPIEGPHEADLFLLERLPETARSFGIAGARAVTPDRWLAEGDAVSVGEVTFSVLHCPGHSPGSVVFVQAEERFVFMGDVLFRGSIGRTDLPGGDHATLIRSIKEKILPLGDDVAFLPGHGPASTVGEERVSNPFLR
jgi:glyoxylase-like metal-dependent hydrolase (beta-lactamase superfamily II)